MRLKGAALGIALQRNVCLLQTKNYSKKIQTKSMDNVMSESQKEKSVLWDDLLKMEKLFDIKLCRCTKEI